VFQNSDRNNDGVLDYDEFRLVLNSKTLNLRLSETEVELICREADTDGDGHITYVRWGIVQHR
jgi:Ca2+-binding EF-hand superfamily protein